MTIQSVESKPDGLNAPSYENFLNYLLKDMAKNLGIPMSALGELQVASPYFPLCGACGTRVDGVRIFEDAMRRSYSIHFNCHDRVEVLQVTDSELQMAGVGPYLARCRPFAQARASTTFWNQSLGAPFNDDIGPNVQRFLEEKIQSIVSQRDKAIKIAEELSDRLDRERALRKTKPRVYGVKPRTISLTD